MSHPVSRLILRGANLLDGDNPGRLATVVVSGERIESVGPAPVDLRPGDRLIDCTGKTVMPGMVLGHFHSAYWGTGGGGRPIGLEAHPSLQAVRAVANIRTALDCGFTGVISAGTPHGIDAALKVAVEEGTISGPRIMAGSRDVGTTGFSADMSNPSYLQIGAASGVTTADGPDGLARIVRQEIKDGAEIVKIFLTGGHATGGSGEDWLMSEAEFAAAMQAAHQRGAKTRAHLASKAAILMSIRHHIHIVDHGDGMDAECIEKLAQTGTFLTPSLLFPKEMMQAMAGHPFAEAMREPWAQMAQILPRASAAGVKLLVGDDYGAFSLTHGRYGEEMTLYVEECGVPALDVIRWATRNGAEAMGLGDQTGTIEAGKLADLLVVDGDPSARIALLQDRANLLAIIKGGQLVKDQLGREQTP